MFASIVLIASLCNVSTQTNDKCGADFEKTWVSNSVTELKKDANNCFDILDFMPDVETVDADHIITRGCYIVSDSQDDNSGKVVLENMLHPEIKFQFNKSDLEVN